MKQFDPPAGELEKFYNKALKFLSYRPRSEQEIRDYLKVKTQKVKVKNTIQSLKLIDEIIEKLKINKLVDDGEFTRWWVESRLAFKPRSLNLIKRELLQKGIDKELIDAQISNFQFPISNELENAKKLTEKRLGRYKNLSKDKIYEKLGRFLASKGFDWDTIKQTIDEILRKRV